MFLTAAFVLAFASPGASAEGPTDGTCDESGLLVCAGANAGANVTCSDTPTSVANCSYTYGWIFTAFSNVGLPGEARFTKAVTVTTCIGNGVADSCTVVTDTASHACSFAALASCDHSDDDAGATGDVAIAPGECLKVTIDVTATAEAWTVSEEDLTLASVQFTNDGGDAGQACNLDNGR